MNVFEYLFQIKLKVNKLNSFIEDADKNNPFIKTLPVTYVWVEDDKR